MTQNERVKAVRTSNKIDLTLEKFGERIGLKKSSLSQIENGINSLTEQNIKIICKEFNVNEEWLRTGTGEMFVEIDRENQLMEWAASFLKEENDSFKRRFVTMLMNLNTDQWEVLAKMAEDLQAENDNKKE